MPKRSMIPQKTTSRNFWRWEKMKRFRVILILSLSLLLLVSIMTSCRTNSNDKNTIEFEDYRPPMLPNIVEPSTPADIFNNWVSTQTLLEKWQSYAMDFLEPLVWDWFTRFDLHNKEVFFTDSQNVVMYSRVYLNIHSITFLFRNIFFSTTFKNKYTPLYIYTYIYFLYIFLYTYIYIYKRI